MSHLASLIPLPDNNQSPRNMYQCQMGKQTMGTPYMTYHRFAENKLYRLLFPASPLFRPVHYDYLRLDDYPQGTNAIVAVISYTVSNPFLCFHILISFFDINFLLICVLLEIQGYDMEDAMIINKSSYERGLCHGCVYKSEHIDLKYVLRNPTTVVSIFLFLLSILYHVVDLFAYIVLFRVYFPEIRLRKI